MVCDSLFRISNTPVSLFSFVLIQLFYYNIHFIVCKTFLFDLYVIYKKPKKYQNPIFVIDF